MSNVTFTVYIETDAGEETWTVNVDLLEPAPEHRSWGIGFNSARCAETGREIEIRDEFEVYALNFGTELDLHWLAFEAAGYAPDDEPLNPPDLRDDEWLGAQ